MLFKIVAVDIVGPIAPPSEEGHGHRNILILVDYATRYPEVVPLKKITSEDLIVNRLIMVVSQTVFLFMENTSLL